MATRTDDFNRANGAPGANWSAYATAGNWSINSNTLRFVTDGIGNNEALRWVGAAMDSADYSVEITITKAANDFQGPGPAARLQAGSLSGYAINAYGDAYYLVRLDSGSETTLASWGSGPGTSAVTLRIEAEGSTIRMFVAGVQRASVTDSTYSTGSPGIACGNFDGGNVTFDNWTSADFAAVAIEGTLTGTLGTLTSSAAAALTIEGELSGTLAAVSLSAAGTLESEALTGALSASLAALTSSSIGVLAVEATLSATLDALTIAVTDYALTFYGNNNGAGTTNIDRVRIPLSADGTIGGADTAADVGAGDATWEFWIRPHTSNNASTGIADVRESNVVVDRDIWAHPRGWVIGLTNTVDGLVVCFGMADTDGLWGDNTIYGSTDVGDDAWHHVAITWDQSASTVALWVDGASEASQAYSVTDLSYPNGEGGDSLNDMDPYLVLGAEKHDADPSQYLSYYGQMDELRISDSLRYASTFTPASRFDVDADTVALYHFDQGTGTTLVDATGNTNGELLVGGASNGPAWTVRSVGGAAGELDIAAVLTATLAALTSSAAGEIDIEGALSSTLAALTSNADGDVALSAVLNATLAALTLDAEATLIAEGTGSLSVTLAELTARAAGELTIEGALSAALAALSVVSTAALSIAGQADATLGALALDATGDLDTGNEGALATTLAEMTASVTGSLTIEGVVALTLGAAVSSGAGTIAIAGQAIIDLDTLTLTGVGVAVVATVIAGSVQGAGSVGTVLGVTAAGSVVGLKSTGVI